MAGILRGDIFWANLNPVVGHKQARRRPVLILSNNTFNNYSGTVIVMALTSRPQKAGFPFTFALDDEQLPKKSWVKNSQIRTLSIKRLGDKIGHISSQELRLIIEGLSEIIQE